MSNKRLCKIAGNKNQTNKMIRRQFINALSKTVGGAAVLSVPVITQANHFFNHKKTITVGEIMDLFIRQIPGAPLANTVDTLKSGSRDTIVTGIITTMFATIPIIQKAIAAKANFIIAHEPTFYNHADEVSWLKNDDVYQNKKELLQQHSIAVWRNHDYIHSLAEDGVREGVLVQLNWKQYDSNKTNAVVTIPETSLQTLIDYVKSKLNIQMVRYIGTLSQSCQKVLLMPGAAGGKRQIEMMSRAKPDVLVCGEISEWETAEYVRDARAGGEALSLIVLGHIASEEPGSEWMKDWLKKNVPGVNAMHIATGNSLLFA